MLLLLGILGLARWYKRMGVASIGRAMASEAGVRLTAAAARASLLEIARKPGERT